MKKYNTAIIGTGFIGVAHIEALRRLGNVDVVALCDTVNAKKKADENYIENSYTDYQTMINELDLDFIHICTPNNTHYKIAKYALESNINVVLEKPMTLDLEEAKELYSIAESKKLVCVINYHNRLYPACAYIKREIEKGRIGEVISINGVYAQDWLLYDYDYSWRLNRNESGKTRAVADIGSHWIDLIEYLSGIKVSAVFADFKTIHPNRKKPTGESLAFSKEKSSSHELVEIDTEDMANILFRFENGAIGNLFVTQMSAGIKNRIDVLISGKEASVEWKLETHEVVKFGYRDKPNEVVQKDTLLMSEVSNLICYPSGHTEGFPDAFKNVFKQAYNQPKDKNYATFKDGLRQMILNERIYESAQTGSWFDVEKVD